MAPLYRNHHASESLADLQPEPRSGPHRTRPPVGQEQSLLARWVGAARLLKAQGLLAPDDLLALLVAPDEGSDELSADERRQRLKAADEELRTVIQQLESSLRERHPDLFDRRGGSAPPS